MSVLRKTSVFLAVATAMGSVSTAQAEPAIWLQEVTGGEVRFYDWGYNGPGLDGTPNGRTAADFGSIGGFNGAKQIQRVVTLPPDRLTPDAPELIKEDLGEATFYWDANMDSQTNFYKWGYTSPAGSTFSNMQIDKDGDYFIRRNDMAFEYYSAFDYQYAGDPAVDPTTKWAGTTDGVYDTNIQFQPYALSDATGWCGSVLNKSS